MYRETMVVGDRGVHGRGSYIANWEPLTELGAEMRVGRRLRVSQNEFGSCWAGACGVADRGLDIRRLLMRLTLVEKTPM